ncbi:MAG: phage head-tail connector protein [Candidatus Omnitrophota bacterium]
MVTLANVKAYLRISDTDATRDALISLLIPIVYADIVEECNNKFVADDYDFSSDDIYFDVTGSTYKILIDAGGFTAMAYPTGGNIIVSGSRLNDGIFTIAAQADTYLTTTEAIVDELQSTDGYTVRVDLCNFPKPLELIASRMIGYQLSNSNSAGLASMSLGNYSETRAAGGVTRGGYPDEILNSLRPWKNHRVGRGTIQWHMNENRTYFPYEVSGSEGGE